MLTYPPEWAYSGPKTVGNQWLLSHRKLRLAPPRSRTFTRSGAPRQESRDNLIAPDGRKAEWGACLTPEKSAWLHGGRQIFHQAVFTLFVITNDTEM
ncbi:hypothetical protein [Acetobacter indonesiensis]|uniref:Uncharacterized protein n=1 Tax=Acetobacter indonesiensis TaxID=104101 RepID=A0A252AMD9_9PROT|nr:hypothetical protein [Acetobacter indonesiensis]OUI90884.1 hypothetical protein HK17_12985 [Acetobacter indonesiensis]